MFHPCLAGRQVNQQNIKKRQMKIPMLHKTLVIFYIVFLVGGNLNAQSKDMPLTYGVRAGMANPVLTWDYQPSTLNRFSPIIGGFVQYQFLPWISASFDILYTQYGGNSYNPLSLYPQTSPLLTNLQFSNLKINTLETPIQAKFGIPSLDGPIKPYASLGCSFAFFLKAKSYNYYLNTLTTSNPIWYSATDNVTSSLKAYDFSGISAVGIDFANENINFSVELFYRLGLTQINANKKNYAPEYRISTIGLKFGVGI
jgi:hypothetical protein